MLSQGVLSHAHHAVVVSVLWAVSPGVQDGPEVGVVESAMDADRTPVSVDSSDSRRRSADGATASVSGGDLVDSPHGGEMERPAAVLPQSGHVLASTAGLDKVRNLSSGRGLGPADARWTGKDRLVRGHRRWQLCQGQKGGEKVGNTKCGKGLKIMALTTGDGLPLAATVHSASPGEATLIEGLLQQRVLKRKLPRLIYDRAADSDPLRVRLTRRGTELICPHRKNRKKPPTQDGRKLRRYKRRWKVERLNAWLQNFRRLIFRHEVQPELFEGLVHAACVVIVLRRL